MLSLLLLYISVISVGCVTNNDKVKMSQFVRESTINGTSTILPPEWRFLPDFYSHGRVGRLSKEERDVTCTACEAAVNLVIDLFLFGLSLEEIEGDLAALCPLIGLSGELDDEVCRGGIYVYGPLLEFIVETSSPTITGEQICGAILGSPENPCGDWEEINNWTVELPDIPKPPVDNPVLPTEGTPSSKIVHLTDIHIDLTYTVGNNALCDLVMCCGNTSGVASSSETAAGYWGDFLCDPPIWTFRNMLEHIAAEHGDDIDYIMITGDLPAHDVWLQSREHNLASIAAVFNAVLEVFPTTQIMPSIGNHEPFPCNILPGTTTGAENSEFDPDWLLSKLAAFYANWLPEEQVNQFRFTAAYSFLYQTGFRIISFPSPLCLTYNFALFLDFSDPSNILEWLVVELFKAEQVGEKVHILSHVPSGNHECLGSWGREYSKIISRFENTVVGHFHGHTHNDHFQVFYDPEDRNRATNVGIISPSVSTYTNLNMAYKIYTIDSGHPEASYRVLDSETYVFDMETANHPSMKDVGPSYYKLYSARADLEMDSLFPGDFDKLVKRLVDDEEFYQKWLTYFYKNASGNGGGGKREILCELLTTSTLDTSKCDQLLGPVV